MPTLLTAAELLATRRLTERLELLSRRLHSGDAEARLAKIYPADTARHLHDKLTSYGNVLDWYLSLDDENAAIFLGDY